MRLNVRMQFLLPAPAIILVLFMFGAAPTQAISQRIPQGIPQAPTTATVQSGNIIVQVRGEDGSLLTNVLVKLYTSTLSPTHAIPIQRGNGFEFQGIESGRYVVEATAAGFETGRQALDYTGAGQNEVVMLFLKPLGTEGKSPYTSRAAFPPKAQKEIQTALHDLESKKYDKARKHVNTALKAAPETAVVHYVMGLTYIVADRAPEAAPYLEKALSLDPRHLQSLIALGNLRIQQQNTSGARELFERALEVSPASWQAHWMLAKCDLLLRNFSSAREHSERAFELGREKAVGAQLVTAEALVGLKEYKTASSMLRAYLQDRPKDPGAEKINRWIVALDRAVASGSTAAPGVAAPPVQAADATADPLPAAPSARASWAPPDADAVTPPLVPGAACNLSEVLAGAAKRAEDLITHLQQFSALEHYESVEIAPNGDLINPVSAVFTYLAFLRRIQPEQFAMEEVREQNMLARQLPGRLQPQGSPSVVLLFHPVYRDDFDLKCEGLGQWNGQSTWLVHFRQRMDRPVRLRNFVTREGDRHPIHLRGRAWIAEGSYRVVHMETDLLEPVTSAKLLREHMSIDYQPVRFPESNVEIWLPQQVDLYQDFRGRLYHQYQRFSDFRLFAVDVKQQIGRPPERNPGSGAR